MFTVIRTYTGNPDMADQLRKRSMDVETLISGVPGFVSYQLLKAPEGTVSITLCESRQSCEETSRRAAEWLSKMVPGLKIKAPQMVMGEVAIQFARAHSTV